MLLHEGRTKQAPHRVHALGEKALVDSLLTFDGIRNRRRRGKVLMRRHARRQQRPARGGQRHGMRRRVGWIPWIRMLVVLEFGVLLHHLLRPGVGGEVVWLAIVIYRPLGRRSMGSCALGLAHCGRAKDPGTSAPDATRIAPARASTLGPRSLARLEHQKKSATTVRFVNKTYTSTARSRVERHSTNQTSLHNSLYTSQLRSQIAKSHHRHRLRLRCSTHSSSCRPSRPPSTPLTGPAWASSASSRRGCAS